MKGAHVAVLHCSRLLRRAIAAGRLRGEVHRGEWCDVGTPERLAALDSRVRAHKG